MCFFAKVAPRLVMRRILKQDLPELCALYATGGRDFAWASAENLQTLFCDAQLWGMFYRNHLICAGGSCAAALAMPLCDALRLTGLVPPTATILLPPILQCDAETASDFLAFLFEKACASSSLFCLIPVQSGAALLACVFTAGFVLTALRPLYALRPHYIFALQSVKKIKKRSIIVPQADTWTLSFLLELGLRGIAVQQTEDVSLLYLE